MINLFVAILKILVTANFWIGVIVGLLFYNPLKILFKNLWDWVKLGFRWLLRKIFNR